MSIIQVNLAFHEADIAQVAPRLGRMEGLRLLEPQRREETQWHETVEKLENLKGRLENILDSLEIQAPELPLSERIEPAQDLQNTEEALRDFENKLSRWQKEREALTDEIGRLQKFRDNMGRLEAVGASFEDVRDLEYLDLRFGHIPGGQPFLMEIPTLRTPVVVMSLSHKEGPTPIVAATDKKHGFVLSRILEALFFEPIELPEASDFSGESLHDLERHIEDTRKRQREMAKEGERMSKDWRDPLLSMLRLLQSNLEAALIVSRYAEPGPWYFLRGVIDKRRLGRLEEAIRKNAENPHAVFAGKRVEASSQA
jgi:vacuolar-type H+-ATPase subunit I/STV1